MVKPLKTLLTLPKKTVRANKSGRIARHKINIQNSVAFLFTNNELSKIKLRSNPTVMNELCQWQRQMFVSFHNRIYRIAMNSQATSISSALSH